MLKLIGQGLQYQVYDLKNGRVKKIPTTEKIIRQKLCKWYSSCRNDPEVLDCETKRAIHTRAKSFKGIQRSNIDPSLLGNPEFLENGVILQDKAEPIGDITHEHVNVSRLIDGCIDLIPLCWEHGFSEEVFNFDVNCGISKGRVILLDFGEVTFSKKKAMRTIKRKKWLTQAFYKSHLKGEQLKSYFSERMDEVVTVANLEKHWKKRT